MERKYKIYCLKHPINLEIRYVGVTVNTLVQRMYHHKYTAIKKKANTHVAKWIRKLHSENLKPIIELIEEVSKEKWEEREKFWIAQFNNLTNIMSGGQGVIVDRSLDSIKRTANAHKKPVVILDKNMLFFKEFESVIECGDFLKVARTAIGNCISKGGGNSGGYFVLSKKQYLEGNYPKIYTGKHKDVYQFNTEGDLLNKFKSLTEASLSCNTTNVRSISDAIKFNRMYNNFYFSYTEKLNKKI